MGRMVEVQEANGQAQERRVAKAVLLEDQVVWSKAPGGYVCESPSGGCYLVTVGKTSTCTCPDFARRCVGSELRCWHIVCLNRKLARDQEAAPAPTAKRAARPLMTDAECAALDRLYN